jgi:predicted aspartyl protease
MKTNGKINFQNDSNIYSANILIDTGASHCFVNQKIFTDSIQSKINDFKLNSNSNELNLKLFNGLIETINSNKKSCCIIVSLNVRIGNWTGLQEFIISDEITNEECILGRDFLKKYNVKIDYGTNKMTIGSGLDFEMVYLSLLENYVFFYFKNLFKKKLTIQRV